MLKPFKSVSMLMTLTGLISTGSAYALATPEVDAVIILHNNRHVPVL